jgi:hypothetical protein
LGLDHDVQPVLERELVIRLSGSVQHRGMAPNGSVKRLVYFIG